jgi:hypothetical protein
MSNIQVMPWDYNKPIKIKKNLKNQSSIPNKYNVEGWNWKKNQLKNNQKNIQQTRQASYAIQMK